MDSSNDPQAGSSPPATKADDSAEGWKWTREHALVIVLVVLTALFCALCALLAWPFLSPLAWALALAIVAHPLHAWLARRVSNANLAAGLAVALVALLIVAPAAFVLHQLGQEAARAAEAVGSGQAAEGARAAMDQHPQLGPVRQWVEAQLGAEASVSKAVSSTQALAKRSIGAAVGVLVTFFFLFFLFRDRRQALGAVRALIPLSEPEADEVFKRIATTIHATIYGTVVVAALQGALGGLMFWWLGLPAPLLWGVIMGLLAIVPVLGAFVVWVPAAIYLLLIGSVWKAIVLAVWGGVFIGLIDNLLYPVLVGDRLRLHTAPIFVSIVGGLALLGAAGLILGPVILAVTLALIDIWRRRTRHGPAEAAVSKPTVISPAR